MGQQARYSESRQIAGRVIGTAPIRSITLFKNDHVLEAWGYNEVSGDDLALTFYSESYPYHPDDNPAAGVTGAGPLRWKAPSSPLPS